MFGEMIGAWVAAIWQAMGRAGLPAGRARPRPRHADGRRAARPARGRGRPEAAEVWFVEASAPLRAEQARRVPGARWAARLEEVPEGPVIVLCQRVSRRAAGAPVPARRRRAGASGSSGSAARVAGPARATRRARCAGASRTRCRGATRRRSAPGARSSPAADRVVAEIARRLAAGPAAGAALVIDYGYRAADRPPGPTLQAVRRHARADAAGGAGRGGPDLADRLRRAGARARRAGRARRA